jgi:hypothetical protein
VALVEQTIGNGIGLTSDQLVAQLELGVPLQQLAGAAGLTSAQLHALEVGAYQGAFDKLIAEGKMTRQDADHRMGAIRRYSQIVLDSLVTDDCLNSGSP